MYSLYIMFYWQRNALRTHLKNHSSQQYECSECPYTSSQKRNWIGKSRIFSSSKSTQTSLIGLLEKVFLMHAMTGQADVVFIRKLKAAIFVGA